MKAGMYALGIHVIFCNNGYQIYVTGFPLFLTRRGSSTGPMGIQDTETLGELLEVRCICWCTSSIMDNT